MSNDKSLEVNVVISQKNLSCTIFDKKKWQETEWTKILRTDSVYCLLGWTCWNQFTGKATCSVHSIFAKTSQGVMKSTKAKVLTKQQGPNIYCDALNIHVFSWIWISFLLQNKTCIFGASKKTFNPFYYVRALKSS